MLNTFVIVLSRLVGRVIDGYLSGGRNEGVGMGYFASVFVLDLVFGLFASMIAMWFSRHREFRADTGGATLSSRDKMISALERLKLNHGDLKATQGDTGHAEIDMITKVYAHILDEDRKINAQKFETAFYSNPDLRAVKPPETPESMLELDHLIEQLRRSPGLKKTISQLVAASDFH